MILARLFDKPLGFRSDFSIALTDVEWIHILNNYRNDDFELKVLSENTFKLVAFDSIGTVISTYSNSFDKIGTEAIWSKKSDQIHFQFSFQTPVQLKWLTIALTGFSLVFLFFEPLNGIFAVALAVLMVVYFRAIYHYQCKTMLKYFKEDIRKYHYFKAKGYDYFKRNK